MPAADSNVDIREYGSVSIARVGHHQIWEDEDAERVSEQLLGHVKSRPGSILLLDLSDVEAFSGNSFPGYLVALIRETQTQGSRLVLANLQPKVAEFFKLFRLDKFFDIRSGPISKLCVELGGTEKEQPMSTEEAGPMPKKTKPAELANGFEFETVFYSNPKKESAFRFRATHIDGKRAPKVILCDDSRIQPGQLCRVRVTSIKKPAAKDRGHIEVEFLSQVTFRLDDSLYVDPILAKKLQALLESGLNILLDGPQGSGKTVLSQKVAVALDMEYVFFNCSSVYEATDFLATLQIRATPSGQVETAWIPTDILRALEAAAEDSNRSFLVFLDEFNRCREMARNGIMPALDATRRLYNPLTGSTIEIPENVLWIAAINNGAQFTGTTSVDPAQLDRFAPLQMDYPPESEEVRILSERHPDVPGGQIERIVKAANAVRTSDELGVDLSVRATEEVCILLGHPNFSDEDPKEALPELLKTSFCGRFVGRWHDSSTDAGMVWNTIVRALGL